MPYYTSFKNIVFGTVHSLSGGILCYQRCHVWIYAQIYPFVVRGLLIIHTRHTVHVTYGCAKLIVVAFWNLLLFLSIYWLVVVISLDQQLCFRGPKDDDPNCFPKNQSSPPYTQVYYICQHETQVQMQCPAVSCWSLSLIPNNCCPRPLQILLSSFSSPDQSENKESLTTHRSLFSIFSLVCYAW